MEERTPESAADARPPEDGGLAPHPPIPLSDRGLWIVLVGALVMQLVTLARLDGYQLADSVEYMDRANMVVNGQPFDPRTPRPFTFSGLLTPFFFAAKVLEFETFDGVVALIRVAQMLVGLATIWVTARIGSRFGGRRLGLVSAVFMAANVAFLRYTVAPVSDPEAMLFMALGVDSLLRPRTQRRGFVTGFYLGASILFTYKALPMVGALLAGVFVRERLRHFKWLRAAVAGIVVCISLAAIVDTKVYGKFASSIGGYFVVNFVSIVSKGVYHAGFEDEGRWLYNTFSGAEKIDQVASEAGDFRAREPQTWYFENFDAEFYSWPLMALVLLGGLASLRRIRYPDTLLLFVVAFTFVLLNNKGSKSFRLFLPLLPMISVLGALGWRALRGYTTVAPGGNLLRSVFAAIVVFVGILATPGMILDLNLREHAGYWRAIEVVNREARRERERLEAQGLEAAPVRAGSAYHWAVSLRQTRDVELVRLPMEMLTYVSRQDREKYDPVREEMLETIASYDWFLAHMQLLWQSPDIMEAVNRNFEIYEVLYDAETYEGLAPICVLRRRSDDPNARTFYEVYPDQHAADVEDYQDGLQHDVGLVFRRELPDGGQQEIELLGWDVEVGLGGGDLAWITYHWYARTDGVENFSILDRITDGDGSAGLVGLDGHRPAYAVHDTSSWRAGTILRESYPRLFPLHPRLFGGDNRRGDLIPARVWIAVQRSVPGSEAFARMEPLHPEKGRPLVPRGPADPSQPLEAFMWESDGFLWDAQARICVGGFWLPVPGAMAIPDDGRSLPPLPPEGGGRP